MKGDYQLREIRVEEKLGSVVLITCVCTLAVVAATYSMMHQQSVN